MTDQHHRLCRLLQPLLQPAYRVDVEVVGRLVEQQHVGTLQQYLCQLYTHAPATAELAGRALQVFASETQSHECPLQFCLAVVGTHHHVAVVLLCEAFHQRHVAVALVVSTLAQLLLEALHTLFHPSHVGKGLLGLLTHRGVVLQHHDLRQIAHNSILWHAHHTTGGCLHATEYLQQRRFSRSVLSHQGNAVAVVDHETHILKERLGAELNA